MTDLLQFNLLLASFLFIAAITPGPNNTILMVYALNHGLKSTLPLIMAVVLGYTSLFFLLTFSITHFLQNIPYLLNAITIGGSVFMLFMAYKLVISSVSHKNSHDTHPKHKKIYFFHIFFFQFANPKAITTSVYAITTFTTPDISFETTLLSVVIVCLSISTCAATFWAAGGHYLQYVLNTTRKQFFFSLTMSILLVFMVLLGLWTSFSP